jgi:hypothetical protein
LILTFPLEGGIRGLQIEIFILNISAIYSIFLRRFAMSKKKQLSIPQEDEFLDDIFSEADFAEEEMLNTFSQVAEASIEHMKVACKLALHISDKAGLSTPKEILDVFRQASDTILECTPLKALFDKSGG